MDLVTREIEGQGLAGLDGWRIESGFVNWGVPERMFRI